jgi:hypothetical protein
MADPELVRVLDYILNRSDENTIEAVSAAVIRRKRDLTMFGGANKLPDPKRMARDLSGQINIGATIDGLKDTVRDMAMRIIRQEAPELTDEQAAELTCAWVPDNAGSGGDTDNNVPKDLLETMVDQFVSYSLGRMAEEEDESLRAELGAWPERYWKAFPQVIQLILTDYLKGKITEGEFGSKIVTALAMER